MGYHPEAGVRRHHGHRHQITQHQEGLACQLKGDWNLLGRLPHHANRDRWVVPPPLPPNNHPHPLLHCLCSKAILILGIRYIGRTGELLSILTHINLLKVVWDTCRY